MLSFGLWLLGAERQAGKSVSERPCYVPSPTVNCFCVLRRIREHLEEYRQRLGMRCGSKVSPTALVVWLGRDCSAARSSFYSLKNKGVKDACPMRSHQDPRPRQVCPCAEAMCGSLGPLGYPDAPPNMPWRPQGGVALQVLHVEGRTGYPGEAGVPVTFFPECSRCS